MYVCVWIMRAQSTRCVVMCQMEANYIAASRRSGGAKGGARGAQIDDIKWCVLVRKDGSLASYSSTHKG